MLWARPCVTFAPASMKPWVQYPLACIQVCRCYRSEAGSGVKGGVVWETEFFSLLVAGLLLLFLQHLGELSDQGRWNVPEERESSGAIGPDPFFGLHGNPPGCLEDPRLVVP